MNRKILIFQFRTDQSLEHERKCFNQMFAGKADLAFLNMFSEEEPKIPSLKNYDGVILSGSGQFNVTDWDDHIKSRATSLYPLIRECAKSDYPMLGICFGHQIMALALGGEVARDKDQAEGGTVEIHLNELGAKESLFNDMPNSFYMVSGHKDSVTILPDNAVNLARSASTNVHSYKVNEHVYAVQFHPEMDRDAMTFRLTLYPEYQNGRSVEAIKNDYHDTPFAKKLLLNFLDLTK